MLTLRRELNYCQRERLSHYVALLMGERTSQISSYKEHNWPRAQLLCSAIHPCILPAATTPPHRLLPECSSYSTRSLAGWLCVRLTSRCRGCPCLPKQTSSRHQNPLLALRIKLEPWCDGSQAFPPPFLSPFMQAFPLNKIFVLLVQPGVCFSEVQTNRSFIHLFIHSFIYSRNIYWVSAVPWHFILGGVVQEWENPPVITFPFRVTAAALPWALPVLGTDKSALCGRSHLFFTPTLAQVLFLFHG